MPYPYIFILYGKYSILQQGMFSKMNKVTVGSISGIVRKIEEM